MIMNIAESYGTSMTATAVKVVQATCEPVAVVLSSNGRVEWTTCSKAFPFTIRRGVLHENTYAVDYFTSGKIPSCTKQVLADAWCSDNRRGQLLTEESIPFERLNMVLSLLSYQFKEEEY